MITAFCLSKTLIFYVRSERLRRRRVGRLSNATALEENLWFSETIEGALRLIDRHVSLTGDKAGDLWRHICALQFFLHAKEHTGMVVLKSTRA